MDYIINPAWFYWIEVADTIKAISIVAIVVLLIACIILAIVVGMDRALSDADRITHWMPIEPPKEDA